MAGIWCLSMIRLRGQRARSVRGGPLPDPRGVKPPQVAHLDARKASRCRGLVDPRPTRLQVARNFDGGPELRFPRGGSPTRAAGDPACGSSTAIESRARASASRPSASIRALPAGSRAAAVAARRFRSTVSITRPFWAENFVGLQDPEAPSDWNSEGPFGGGKFPKRVQNASKLTWSWAALCRLAWTNSATQPRVISGIPRGDARLPGSTNRSTTPKARGSNPPGRARKVKAPRFVGSRGFCVM
jgi:hypothetical protein